MKFVSSNQQTHLMATTEILIQLLLAGVLGITGQLLRVVVGMKKLNETASQNNVSTKSLIVTSSMVISILIGFATGILAWLAISDWQNNFFDSKQRVLGIIAAGYSGTDFIEGFMSK